MALRKARTFEYRPSRRRQEQLDGGKRPRIELPRAGAPNRLGSLKLLIFLVAILALAFVMVVLR